MGNAHRYFYLVVSSLARYSDKPRSFRGILLEVSPIRGTLAITLADKRRIGRSLRVRVISSTELPIGRAAAKMHDLSRYFLSSAHRG